MSVRHRFFGLLRAASLLMILVTLGLLSAIITMHFVIHGAEVKVPSLKAMNGRCRQPPNSTKSGLTSPGLRPGPTEL